MSEPNLGIKGFVAPALKDGGGQEEAHGKGPSFARNTLRRPVLLERKAEHGARALMVKAPALPARNAIPYRKKQYPSLYANPSPSPGTQREFIREMTLKRDPLALRKKDVSPREGLPYLPRRGTKAEGTLTAQIREFRAVYQTCGRDDEHKTGVPYGVVLAQEAIGRITRLSETTQLRPKYENGK